MSDPYLQFFRWEHLPAGQMREASKPFAGLAQHIVDTLPRNPQRTKALSDLLRAKDCAVRAVIYEEPTEVL